MFMTSKDYEEAAISYTPDDHGQDAQLALTLAEQLLSSNRGVTGVGLTKTSRGEDAIMVYVKDHEALNRLPSEVSGLPILGEISGDIQPL